MKTRRKKGKILFIAALAVIVVALGSVFIWYSSMTGAVENGNTEEIIIDIPNGSSTSQIAQILDDTGTIKSQFVFRIKSKIGGYDGTYKAGKYAVSKNMNMEEQMELIASGISVGQSFTVTEGTNTFKIAALLESHGIVSEEDFLYEIQYGDFDYEFLKDAPEGVNRLEGFLYPETYKIELDATAHDIIDMMLSQFEKIYEKEYKDKIEKTGYSVSEIMTVASIIEREAKITDDKKNVASVIYNRLEINMPLQMDSILAYITGEEKIKASYEDTQVESDYNPYQNYGLPPGPICSPGKDSIEAAINPPDTDYLYFVATEKLDGTNVFSETYEDFLKNVEKFNEAYKEYVKDNPGVV